MAATPHYRQTGGEPAVVGRGPGVFDCACGQSTLIAGYDPRNFLNIAIRCAACGEIAETPGLPDGAIPPAIVTLVERGTEQPPPIVAGDVTLISQEEMDRLAALYQPRAADLEPMVMSDALLDEVEAQQRPWTNASLDAAADIATAGYKDQALVWAFAHFRDRLRDPNWPGFTEDTDMVAVTVIAAFRDLFSGWAHHPLFPAMIGTAAAQGFSLHAMAMFGAAKSLAAAGNRIGFVTTTGAWPRILSVQLVLSTDEQMGVAVNRFDRFEWPDGAQATPQSVRSAVIAAMASVQGTINRVRPGMLVLSPGAVEGTLEQLFVDSIVAAMGSHGRRHRGLAAVSVIFPKIQMTGKRREVRFGYSFYPVANRNHSIGRSVRIGSRADFAGIA